MKQVTPRQIYDRWLAALRSGEYKQITGSLKGYDYTSDKFSPGFCCLGVLEDLTVKDGGPDWGTNHGPVSHYGIPREVVLKFMGLDEEMVEHLIKMNDKEENSFDEIADEIEFNIMPAVGV